MIKTVDMDVVVVLVIHLFQQLGLSEFWIDFDVGRNAKFSPCHQIAGDMFTSAMCNGLTFFHAVSDCGTCSAFFGKAIRVPSQHGKHFLI